MVSVEAKDYILKMGHQMFSAWPEDCFLSSILTAKKGAEQWLADTYIQICAYKDVSYHGLRINFFPSGKHHFWINSFDYCPFLRKYSFDNDVLLDCFGTFAAMAKYSLSKGYYVSTLLNQTFRERTKLYLHPAYFYGYKQRTDSFLLVDSFEDGKFLKKEVPSELIEKAMNEANNSFASALSRTTYMYKIKDYLYVPDYVDLANRINDYLDGVDSTHYKGKGYDNKIYGIECYKLMLEYLEYIRSTEAILDLKSFVFIEDCQRLACMRIHGLANAEVITENIDKILYLNKQAEYACEQAKNLAMKYNVRMNKAILNSISDNIVYVIKCDMQYNDMILTQMKNKNFCG